jgi:hypothetical protein
MLKTLLTFVMAMSLISPNMVLAQSVDASKDQIAQKIEELNAIEKEIEDIQSKIDSAKTARTVGVAIGVTVATGTMIWGMLHGITDGVGKLFGASYPKFRTEHWYYIASGASAAGTGVWFYIKTSEISALKDSLEAARSTSKDLREALASSLN